MKKALRMPPDDQIQIAVMWLFHNDGIGAEEDARANPLRNGLSRKWPKEPCALRRANLDCHLPWRANASPKQTRQSMRRRVREIMVSVQLTAFRATWC